MTPRNPRSGLISPVPVQLTPSQLSACPNQPLPPNLLLAQETAPHPLRTWGSSNQWGPRRKLAESTPLLEDGVRVSSSVCTLSPLKAYPHCSLYQDMPHPHSPHFCPRLAVLLWKSYLPCRWIRGPLGAPIAPCVSPPQPCPPCIVTAWSQAHVCTTLRAW